jgi:hypothetical protein
MFYVVFHLPTKIKITQSNQKVSNQQEELQFLKATDGNSTIINGDLKKSNCSIAEV